MLNKRGPVQGFRDIWQDSELKDWVIDFRATACTPAGMWLACKANLVTPLMMGTLISPVRWGKKTEVAACETSSSMRTFQGTMAAQVAKVGCQSVPNSMLKPFAQVYLRPRLKPCMTATSQ